MPKQELAFQVTPKSRDRKMEVDLTILLFLEDNVHIAYCPALDLSGYGKTEEEADESFKTCLGEFFTFITDKKTLTDILKDMGWIIERTNNSMIPPSWEDLKVGNDNVKFILSNYSYKILDKSVKIPALV